MLTKQRIAATMGAATVLVAGFGATAVSAAPASASSAPAAVTGSGAVSGPTYVMMNAGRYANKQDAWVEPSTFFLMKGGPNLYAKRTAWSGWDKYSATGSGRLYVADMVATYLGHVTLRFSDRKTNAHFTGTSKRFSYFENVHVIGGTDLASHYWHWSWAQHNWDANGQG